MSTTASFENLGKRSCYYRYGNRYCDGWSNGTRIGVGIAIAVGVVIFILLILGLGARRRRRMASSTQPMFTANQQQPSQGSYYQGQGAYPQTGYNATGGQYPNQGYYYGQQQQYQQDNPVGPEIGGFKYPPQRDDNTGGQTYAPPSGPPPGVSSPYAGGPAAPPPAYAEDADKRV